MIRSHRPALGGLALAAVLATAPLPAHAAGTTTVTSPRCGTVQVTAATTAPTTVHVSADNGAFQADLAPGVTRSFSDVAAGSYTVRSATQVAGEAPAVDVVTVAGCGSTWPRRPADGDQTGDGRADVLGVQAGTGNLYLYRTSATGTLTGTTLVGSGWNSMVYLQQVKEIDGAGSGNSLIAVRSDGTVWQYDNPSAGRFTNPRQIGSGLTGRTNFVVVPQNNPVEFGHYLLASRTSTQLEARALGNHTLGPAHTAAMNPAWSQVVTALAPRAFDSDPGSEMLAIDTSGVMTAWQNSDDTLSTDSTTLSATVVGRGWQAMGTVTTPGSLDGDRLTDLLARRTDGNLYRYANQDGRWGSAVQIGRNWNGIRLLA